MPRKPAQKKTRKTKRLFKRTSTPTTLRKSVSKTRSKPTTVRTRAKKPLFSNPPSSVASKKTKNLNLHTPVKITESPNKPPQKAEDQTPLVTKPPEVATLHNTNSFEPIKTSVKVDSHQQEIDQPEPVKPPSNDIAALRKLIEQTTQKISQIENEKIQDDAQPSSTDSDPESFDGVSSQHEEHQIINDQLDKLERQNAQLKRQLQMTQEEFKKEKDDLEKTIKELRSEVKRTVPLQESKFFSISKELREAVKAIENLNDPGFVAPDDSLPVSNQTVSTSANPEPKKIKVSQPLETPPQTPTDKKKVSKEKKLLITGGAIITVLSLGSFLSWNLTKTPKIDQDLVDAYLEQNGQVQGIQSDINDTVAAQNKKVATDRYQELPFDQTEWDVYEDLLMGFRLKFPLGITEKLNTGSSLTILRKEGYLFKVQTYQTTQTIQEFWSEQKPTVNYTVSETKLSGTPAIHLQLTDQVEFPGDRYLIQGNNKIFDLWVANPSDKFSSDDIQRAQFMLESFRAI